MNTDEASEQALIEHSRIQRIALDNPPQWAVEQMELVTALTPLCELAEQLGWDD